MEVEVRPADAASTAIHGPLRSCRPRRELMSVNKNAVALHFADRAAAYQALSELKADYVGA